MFKKLAGTMLAITALVAPVALMAPAANASSTAIRIGAAADRSVSHRVVFVRAFVVCSEDTFSAALTTQVSQVAPDGTVQVGTSAVLGLGSVECTGDVEKVLVPVRKPIGGYNWRAGAAAVTGLQFITQDPTGVYSTVLPKRAINIK